MSAQKELLYRMVEAWLIERDLENTAENCEAGIAAIMEPKKTLAR